MVERFFLYIDILGFKEMIKAGGDISELYRTIDELNVHKDTDFTCIVFSDTILVYGDELWLRTPREGIMWLIEFAQDLFYRLIVKDIHFRAYITLGNFEHYKLKNLEAYFGQALVECYEREKQIQCLGVFLDARLVYLSDIFCTTPFNTNVHFVHVMQHLDQVSFPYKDYPISGNALKDMGMEWWVAYLLRYLETIYRHGTDNALSARVQKKYRAAWKMIAKRHPGLLRRLIEVDFKVGDVVTLDWTEPFARIGTNRGAFG